MQDALTRVQRQEEEGLWRLAAGGSSCGRRASFAFRRSWLVLAGKLYVVKRKSKERVAPDFLSLNPSASREFASV